MPTIRTFRGLLPATALLVSCGGGDLVLPSEGEPAAITIVQGDAQSGRAGDRLAELVVARVTDSQGRPVINVPVTLVLTDGIGATVAPDTAATDADGRAPFQVVLGTEVGRGSGEVRVGTAGGGRTLTAPLEFTSVSADANELVAVAGDSQSARVGGTLSDPLVVQVTDAFGNPIAGVDVAWAAGDGGDVSQATVATGDDGLASVQVTLGPNAGIQHTTASAPGLAGSPVTFTHTALPGAATTLERISGDGQSTLVGTSLPDPLIVRARDGAGNPVAGLGVTWVVTSGGGSVLPQNGTTGTDGLASTRWTLGRSPGTNTVTAVISGVGTVGFTATGTPGAPPGLSVEIQPPPAAVRGMALGRDPVVQLREPDGSARAQSGVSIGVGLEGAGGTLRGTLTRTIGPDGRAEFRGLVLEGPAGSYALGFAAPGYTGAVSSTIALARAPTTIEITADEPDPSEAGAAVRVAFRVRSPGGTLAGTVRVSADDGTDCSASTSDGACTLSLAEAGSRTITAAYSGSTEFEGSSDTESHEVRAAPPAETTTAITADDPDPSEPGQAVSVRFTVTSDAGTPAGTVTVTRSDGGEGCSASVAAGRCTLVFNSAGAVTLTAGYAGEGGFAGSSDTESHTVLEPASPPPPPVPSAAASTVVVGDASIPLGGTTSVTVTVRDAGNAVLQGVPVTLTATGSDNQIAPPTAATDGGGIARFTFGATTAGSRTLTAVAGGVTLAPRPVVTVEQAQTTTRITADDPDPSAPGAPITVRFTVAPTTGGGTPTGTVTVTASGGGEPCTGTLAQGQGSCALTPTSDGTLTLSAGYSGDAGFAPSSDSETHTVAAPRLAIHKQPSRTATIGVPFQQQPEVELQDASGRKIDGRGVTVTASLVSGIGVLAGTLTSTTGPNGRAAFDDLAITGVPDTYTIQFSAAGFAPTTSDPIEVSAAPSSP